MPIHGAGFSSPYDLAIIFGVFLVVAIPTVFWIIEIVDAARRQFPDATVKVIWLLVIFFTHFVGALVYYFIGKRQGTLPAVTRVT